LKIATGLTASNILTSPMEHADATSYGPFICFNCGKEGHKAASCKAPKKGLQTASVVQFKQSRKPGRYQGRLQGRGHGGRGGGTLKNKNTANVSFKQDDIVHGCSARVVEPAEDVAALEYYSPDFLDQHRTADTTSPSAIHAHWLTLQYLQGQDISISPEDTNSFDPNFITWNLPVWDVFNTKTELTRPSLCYGGDYFGTLKEPIFILTHYDPLTFDGSQFFMITHPGILKSARKRS